MTNSAKATNVLLVPDDTAVEYTIFYRCVNPHRVRVRARATWRRSRARRQAPSTHMASLDVTSEGLGPPGTCLQNVPSVVGRHVHPHTLCFKHFETAANARTCRCPVLLLLLSRHLRWQAVEVLQFLMSQSTACAARCLWLGLRDGPTILGASSLTRRRRFRTFGGRGRANPRRVLTSRCEFARTVA